jgi:adenosylhomocysteine nucleosidase
METIGLIAAMPSEREALLRRFRGWKRSMVGSAQGIRFQIMDRDCVLVTSGMGVRRAAQATRILIEAIHPACLVSFGIAGAAREDLKIGDVVMATRNCSLENGRLSQSRPIASLATTGREAAEQALKSRGARLLIGTAITTRGAQLVQPHPELSNPILEMETAGILQAAAGNQTPLVILRSVSDGPLAPIPFDLETVMDDEYNFLPGQLLLAILKQPRLLLQSRRMTRNSRIAADNAAVAVMAVLEQPGSLQPIHENHYPGHRSIPARG